MSDDSAALLVTCHYIIFCTYYICGQFK